MASDNIFSGVSGAFWALTFALIVFSAIVAAVGSLDLIRVCLAIMCAYSIVGILYGSWAARRAISQSRSR